MMFDEHSPADAIKPVYPYFHRPEPLQFEDTGWYAMPDSDLKSRSFEWSHSIADIIAACLSSNACTRS